MTSLAQEVSPMKKTIVAIAVVLISVTCCIWVFGLAMEYPVGTPVGRASYWPEGLGELVDRENRVHGFFVNASDYFYFTGDANAFNEFLEQYALLKGTPLRLVLHPGRGLVSPWDEDKEIPFEWQVSAFGWEWPQEKYPDLPPVDEGECTDKFDAGWAENLDAELDEDQRAIRRKVHQTTQSVTTDVGVVMMDLYLGGQVALDKVKVPLNVEVKSGGDIDKFIAAHEARQQAQNLAD